MKLIYTSKNIPANSTIKIPRSIDLTNSSVKIKNVEIRFNQNNAEYWGYNYGTSNNIDIRITNVIDTEYVIYNNCNSPATIYYSYWE